MRTIILLALLLPLCYAAPLEKKGQNVDGEAHHGQLHGHGEDKVGLYRHVHEGDHFGHDHREQKLFSQNKFELGDIGVSGSVTGGDISMGHKIEIDIGGYQHKGHAHDDRIQGHGDLSHGHDDLSHGHGDLSHGHVDISHDHGHGDFSHGHGDFNYVHGISTEENLRTKIEKIDENIKAIEKLKSAIENINDQENLEEKLKEIYKIIKEIEKLKTEIGHIHDQGNLKENINKIDKNIEELKAATENINDQMKTPSSRGKRSTMTAAQEEELWKHIDINMKMIDDLLDECQTTLENYQEHLAKLKEMVSPWVDSVLEKFTATTEINLIPVQFRDPDFSVQFNNGSASLRDGMVYSYSSFAPTDGINFGFNITDDVTNLRLSSKLSTDNAWAHYNGIAESSLIEEDFSFEVEVNISQIHVRARIPIQNDTILQLTNLKVETGDVSVMGIENGPEWMIDEIEARTSSQVKSEVAKLIKLAIQNVFNSLSGALPSLNR